MGPVEQAIISFISSLYSAIQWPGVVALMAIESACIPLPSEIIMPLAGWMLVKEQQLPAVYTLVAGAYGALGCTLGSIIAYVVGSRGGRPFLRKYGKYLLVSHHDLDLADRFFAHRGSLTAFVSRLLPVVRTFISLPAGIARMNLFRFVVYTFVGSFIWCTALAYGGYVLGTHWEELRTFMRPFDPVIIAVGAILIAIYIYRHVRQPKARAPLPER